MLIIILISHGFQFIFNSHSAIKANTNIDWIPEMGNHKIYVVHICVKNNYDNMSTFFRGKCRRHFPFENCQRHFPSENACILS